MVEPNHSNISLNRQLQLLDLPKSSYYYKKTLISSEDLRLLRIIDEEYTRHPFLGSRRMCAYLQRLGHVVNRKRMQKYYRILAIEAIYPKPKLSKKAPENKIYPYLLRGLPIDKCNKVWSTDITYIRLPKGFIYLVAIIDWYSRFVLDWDLSTSLEADFCIETLSRVLSANTNVCDIFNTDQGSQFTSIGFTKLLLDKQIKISMDGKGRALDNIIVERLWRNVKYECVYLHEFASIKQARDQIAEYFEYYNHGRQHQSLSYNTPFDVYSGKVVNVDSILIS